jgi:tetratricopeptide (TPR) repeat protein
MEKLPSAGSCHARRIPLPGKEHLMLETINSSRGRWFIGAAALAAAALVAGCHHKSVDDFLAAGDAAMQTNQLADAETDYNDAVKAAPNDPRTHIALGNLYIFEHKTSPAQVEFMKVLDLDPKNAATHIALGNLYMDQSQYPLAENQYRAACALEPERPTYHLDLAQALIKQNKQNAAEDEIRTALGLDPKNAQAHYALANLLNSMPNRQSEAQAEYDQARALDAKLSGPGGETSAPSEAEAESPSAAAAQTPGSAAIPAMAPPAGASTAAAAVAPASVPSEGSAPAVPAPATLKIKPLNKLFLLTKNSPVYQDPDQASTVLAQVRQRKYVHVTGITGDYLQIRLRNGTIGFIPVTAAE